jgi:outer membrane lipoprotein-sorting protein
MHSRVPLACLLAGWIPLAAQPANELLRRVAEHYQSINEFRLEAKGLTQSEWPGRTSPAIETRFTLAASGADRIYFEARHNFRSLLVADGHNVWTWNSESRRQRKEPLDPGPDGIPKRLADSVSFLFGRFRLLGSPHLRTQVLGEEDLLIEGQKVRCTIVAVTPPPPDTGRWSDRLWIDPQTLLVRKSIFYEVTSLTPEPTSQVRTLLWTAPSTGQPLPPSLFVFTPPGMKVRRSKTTPP